MRGEPLVEGVVREEFRTRDPGRAERPVDVLRQPDRVEADQAPRAARLFMHGAQERQKVRLDLELARPSPFGPLLPLPVAVPRPADMDGPVFKVDVFPPQPPQLASARAKVDRQAEDAPPVERDLLARHELQEFVRVEKSGAPVVPHVGRLDIGGGIRVKNAQARTLGPGRVAQHLADDRPDAMRRAPL
jgi:hypothetical protein